MPSARAEDRRTRYRPPGGWWWWLTPVVLFGVLSCPVEVRGQTDDPTPHSDVRLIAEHGAVAPGSTVTLGLLLELDPGWHTYWRNPGDSGSEAILEWELPPDFVAGPVQWPRPELVPVPPLMSYAYHDEVVMLTDVRVPKDAAVGSSATLVLSAEWLVCQDICLPAFADLTLTLPVVETQPPPVREHVERFSVTRELLPLESSEWTAVASTTAAGYALRVWPPDDWDRSLEDSHFFVFDPTSLDHAVPQTPVWDRDHLTLSLVRSPYNTNPDSLDGVLVRMSGGGFDAVGRREALALDIPVVTVADGELGVTDASGPLLTGLLFAFLGGLLLNLMPCVFPVLSLKVVGFVEHAAGDPRRTRMHGVAFAAGVILSFLVLAAVLLAVRGAGSQVGWGFQLQSPAIVAALCILLFGIGLVLAGVAELGLGLTRLGGVAAQDRRYRGSFLTGVLATVVATPCTAPFMGAAIGVALVRPAMEGLLVFATLGAGMATPYLLLSSWPALLARVPRPGPWMETLKQALSFPMFGVAAWLVWVFGLQTGVGGAAALLTALILVAFGMWVLGRWPAPAIGRRKRLATRIVAIVVFVAAGWSALEGARMVPPTAASTGSEWEAFGDGSLIDEHRRGGRPVFVDFTAAWCISCQVNERVVLSSSSVQEAFRAGGVALVKADWTRRDPVITRALASFGRSGVPLYVLYPSDLATDPELLPSVLTHGIVMDALERVTKVAAAYTSNDQQ